LVNFKLEEVNHIMIEYLSSYGTKALMDFGLTCFVTYMGFLMDLQITFYDMYKYIFVTYRAISRLKYMFCFR